MEIRTSNSFNKLFDSCSGHLGRFPTGREVITDFLEDNFEKIRTDFEKLKPKDSDKLYCDLLPYSLPKPQAIDVKNSDNKKIVAVINRNNKAVNHPLKEQQ